MHWPSRRLLSTKCETFHIRTVTGLEMSTGYCLLCTHIISISDLESIWYEFNPIKNKFISYWNNSIPGLDSKLEKRNWQNFPILNDMIKNQNLTPLMSLSNLGDRFQYQFSHEKFFFQTGMIYFKSATMNYIV